MGVEVGVVIGLIGVAILIVPFIIQIYVGSNQGSTGAKRALEASSAIIAVAVIFFVGGLILAAYFSGKEIVAAQSAITGEGARYGGKYGGEGAEFVAEHPQLLELAAA